MTKASGATEPLDGLVQLVASRGDAVSGLRAIGREVGGRAGRRVVSLADRLERGETASGALESGPLEQTLIQAAAAPAAELAGRLASCITLNRLRAELTHRVVIVGWFSLLYGWLASLAGWWLIASTEEMVTGIVHSMGIFGGAEQLELMAIWKRVCAGFVMMFSLLMVLWSLRGRVGCPVWVERLWARVPMVGPAMDAIELAGFCESMRRSIEADSTYPQALRAVATGEGTSRLRHWARQSIRRIEAGGSFQCVMCDLPLRDGWLAGVSGPLADHPRSSPGRRAGWHRASDRMHELAIKRVQRVVSTLAPLATILSLGIAYTAVGVSLGFLKMLVELISGLT